MSRTETEAEPAATDEKKTGWRRFEFVIIIAVALAVAFVIRSFVIQQYWIPSGSMEGTLVENDRVLVNKLVYHFRDITRGEVIVFSGEGTWGPTGTGNGDYDYVKRVIGLPGDVVESGGARDGVSVNGVKLDEAAYLPPGVPSSSRKFKVTVPAGHVWVMGDNRTLSMDSRAHREAPGNGAIPIDKIEGRAFAIVWPLDRAQIIEIPQSFAKLNAS